MKLLLSALLLVSVSSFAGIKETKIKAASELKIKSGLAAVMKACGNKKLTAKIDWSQWAKYKYKSKDKMYSHMTNIGNTLIPEIYNFMAKTCKADKLYKTEIGKLTTLTFAGKAKKGEMYAAYALKGTSLAITLNADGYGSWKNESLLKKVWE